MKLSALNEGRLGDLIDKLKPGADNVGELLKKGGEALLAAADENYADARARFGKGEIDQEELQNIKGQAVRSVAGGVADLMRDRAERSGLGSGLSFGKSAGRGRGRGGRGRGGGGRGGGGVDDARSAVMQAYRNGDIDKTEVREILELLT